MLERQFSLYNNGANFPIELAIDTINQSSAAAVPQFLALLIISYHQSPGSTSSFHLYNTHTEYPSDTVSQFAKWKITVTIFFGLFWGS